MVNYFHLLIIFLFVYLENKKENQIEKNNYKEQMVGYEVWLHFSVILCLFQGLVLLYEIIV